MILENLRLWAHERTPNIPRNVDDLETVEFADVLGAIAEDHHLTRCAQVCFASTEEEADQEAGREADLLEQMPLLDHPESDKERLASWLRPPRRARVAIRQLHRNLRSLSRETLVQMSRAVRAPQNCINAAKTFRCQGCDNTRPTPQTHKVSPN